MARFDLAARWFNLTRGVVRKHQTKLKTEALRRGMAMLPELAEALSEWRLRTPYNQPNDWVFASPFRNGKSPYWLESALKDHVRPAAERAGITKIMGWHTFRHSLATLLGNQKEDTKTVQELMRHANSRRSEAADCSLRLWHTARNESRLTRDMWRPDRSALPRWREPRPNSFSSE